MIEHTESSQTIPLPNEVINRFWNKVKTGGDCWLWVGQLHGGYGRLEKRVKGVRTLYYAHRISWQIHNGPIPKGLHVLHECDNPSCVNPEHLFLGTQRDNNNDKLQKGRQAKGEQFPFHKLTKDLVRQIRIRYSLGDVTQQALADQVGVSLSQINWVIHGKAWTHVTSM